ncbi:myb/SANT-like DNA-binding domain-containing protein 3 isoform X4 [Xenopus laevis]|uniref:Myb/SANT-like DNA-binding domain-containing protein 3 n=1 Tax=Xenopus laevis TaxID=8355 RepID=A0A8J0U529_XENLA|nr:myb/SANT-like DNA-binding domain-containing protein 3 isoform X4 [Xenopus laevis]
MQNNEVLKPAKYFSELEKSVLLALVEKYKYVLECKKSDARTIALKQRTWQALAHEYNSQPSVSLRDFKQLKKCWENIKARTKKIMAHERREKGKLFGPESNSHQALKEKVASMIPEQLYFVHNQPDEGRGYNHDTSNQESFIVPERDVYEDQNSIVNMHSSESSLHSTPIFQSSKLYANRTYGRKPSQNGIFTKMHEEQHHQQLSVLQLQLIQVNEVHVAKVQQIERECEMAEEEHRIKMEILNKKKMYWERKLQTITKEWPVASFNRPFPNSP